MSQHVWVVHPPKNCAVFRDDPCFPGVRKHNLTIPFADLKVQLPDDLNPRQQKLSSKVSKGINESCTDSSNNFQLRNRGLLVVGSDVRSIVENGKEAKEIVIPKNMGIVDGETTEKVIMAALVAGIPNDILSNKFVEVEVFTGIDNLPPTKRQELLTIIARDRNTSLPVIEISLMNLDGYFENMKKAMKPSYAQNIIWEQNGEGGMKAQTLLNLLTSMNPDVVGNGENELGKLHPSTAYHQATLVQEKFKDNNSYAKMYKILSQILELHDYMIVKSVGHYDGKAGCQCTSDNDSIFQKVDKDMMTMFTVEHVPTVMKEGGSVGALLAWPMIMSYMSAFGRNLLVDKGDCFEWAIPFEEIKVLYDKLAVKLLEATRRALEDSKHDTPDRLGRKGKPFWDTISDIVEKAWLRDPRSRK